MFFIFQERLVYATGQPAMPESKYTNTNNSVHCISCDTSSANTKKSVIPSYLVNNLNTSTSTFNINTSLQLAYVYITHRAWLFYY